MKTEKKILFTIRIEPSIIEKYKKLADKKAKTLYDGQRVTEGYPTLMRTVLKKYIDIYF